MSVNPEIVCADPARLRIVQAACDVGSANIHNTVIRIEPDGTAVSTDGVLLVVARHTFAPLPYPLHIRLGSRVLARAEPGRYAEGVLALGNTEVAASIVALGGWHNYRASLERLAEGVPTPRSHYALDVKRIHALVSSHPDWPRRQTFDLLHLSDRSVQIDLGMEGVTALLALARTTY